MISFKQFIIEEPIFKLDKFANDCKPFLDAWMKGKEFDPNHLPFHGTRYLPYEWKIIQNKETRKPRNTNVIIHDMINDFLEDKIEWRVREDGVFVSGFQLTTPFYGDTSVVFPIGEFRSFYIKNMVDLAGWIANEKYEIDLDADDGTTEKERYELILDIFKREFALDGVVDQNIKRGLDMGYEMILKAKSYYQFNKTGKIFTEIIMPYLATRNEIK